MKPLLPLLVFAGVLAGCAVGPNDRPIPTALDGAKNWTGTGAASLRRAEASRAWWEEFGDATLRRLVAEVRAANLDVKVAEARVRQSRARVGVETSALFPVPAAGGNWTKFQTNENLAQGQPMVVEGLFNASTDATWELDVFGRVRRQVQAARADAHADVFAREDVLAIVSAEVGRRYVELRGAQAGLAVAEENVRTFRDIVALNESLVTAGQITEVQVEQARTNLRLAEASVPTFLARAEIAADRIALLLGRPPGYLRADLLRSAPLPEMPATVAGGIPSDLLIRRPDVRAAAQRVAATTARIGVAEADLLPRFAFQGGVRLDAASFTGLFAPGAGGYSFGPAVTWTGLDFWRVLAQVRAARARNDELVATFEQTVLGAAREVSEQMVLWTREKERAARLVTAVTSGREASSLARSRYERGLEDFLTVLQAELTRLSAEAQLVSSETEARLALVSLYRALGGGWQG